MPTPTAKGEIVTIGLLATVGIVIIASLSEMMSSGLALTESIQTLNLLLGAGVLTGITGGPLLVTGSDELTAIVGFIVGIGAVVGGWQILLAFEINAFFAGIIGGVVTSILVKVLGRIVSA